MAKYGIEPVVLPVLGRELLSHDDIKYRDIATTLLICGLDSGDFHAMFFAAHWLLNDAILTGRYNGPGVAAARRFIQEQLTGGFPSYVYLEGKLLEHEGKPLQALQLYQAWSDKETQTRKGASEGTISSRNLTTAPEHGDICKALARLRARLGDRTGAEEAIRDAALVYDDPVAYYHLAIEYVVPGSAEFERYLLKAASSDEPKASHELGMFYFNQSRQGLPLHEPKNNETDRSKDPSRDTVSSLSNAYIEQGLSREAMLDKRAEAMEWFNIAAESGVTASQVYLALLLREAGRAEEGLTWLQAATKSSDADDWTVAVEYFKRMWRLSAPNPMQLNIESLRQSSKDPKKQVASRLAGLADATPITDAFLHQERIGGQLRLNDQGRRRIEKDEQ
ncbi:MAG: hypothetical protein Q9168_008109, partial [Polycauliona sp. 1 TL-2023]